MYVCMYVCMCGCVYIVIKQFLQVRVATEGINGTVGGTKVATGLYIKAMCCHPIFNIMEKEDFKVKKKGFSLGQVKLAKVMRKS